MRRGLVGNDVDLGPDREQVRHDVGRVAQDANGKRLAAAFGLHGPPERVIDPVGSDVEVAGVEPALDPRRIDLYAQRHATVHRDRHRLGTAHPAQPCREGYRAGEAATVALRRDCGEGFVGSLQDALGSDVDP